MDVLKSFSPSFFRSLQQLKIRTRRAYLGSRQGSHLSSRRGHGLEFADYKAYSPGDDFRHIDWGIYGRTDRAYVRQFREEQDLNVLILLDTSASMGFPPNEGKFTLASEIALALGFIALASGDSVNFGILGHKLSPRFSGERAFRRAASELNRLEPSGHVDLVREVRAAVMQQRNPGKCFFISDFLDESPVLTEAIDIIRARNFELVLVQVLSPSELRLELKSGAYRAVDAETGEEFELALDSESQKEYAEALASHVAALEQHALRLGLPHVLIPSSESLGTIMLNRLPALGVLQ